MSDLTNELRDCGEYFRRWVGDGGAAALVLRAADEIERLESANAKLREACEAVVNSEHRLPSGLWDKLLAAIAQHNGGTHV